MCIKITVKSTFRFGDQVQSGHEVLVYRNCSLMPSKIINITKVRMQGEYHYRQSKPWHNIFLIFSLITTG